MKFKVTGRVVVKPEEAAPLAPRPGNLQRAVNFGKAVVKEGVHKILGRPARTQAEKEFFYRTCQACPGNFYNTKTDECHHPGCGCPMGRKSRWDSTTCPGGYVDFAKASGDSQ